MYAWGMRNTYNTKRKDHQADLDESGRIMLKSVMIT